MWQVRERAVVTEKTPERIMEALKVSRRVAVLASRISFSEFWERFDNDSHPW